MLDNLNPPFSVSALFLVLAVVTTLAGMFVVLLPLVRRINRRVAQSHLAVPTHVRTKYEKELDEVRSSWEDGELTGRQAAQSLSMLIRRFAREAWDVDIEHMTLQELRAFGIRPVAHAVANIYPAAFGDEEITDVSANFDEMRKVVGMWTF